MSINITKSYETNNRYAYSKASNTSKNDEGVTSTAELKTDKPGVTRTEQIKTGFKDINNYSKYLQSKYSFMNKGTVSMSGIPTTITVSPAFLKKCNKDPEKAAFLEENLAAIPQCMTDHKSKTAMLPGNPVATFASWSIDANGEITMMSGCTNDPDGKIARENALKKASEDKSVPQTGKFRAKKKAKRKNSYIDEKYFSAKGKNTDTVSKKMNSLMLGGKTGLMSRLNLKI